jgi:hypothetical protein
MKRSRNSIVLASALVLEVALTLTTPAPAAELRARGILDMTLSSGTEARVLNGTTQGDSNFDPYKVLLFVDAAVTPTITVSLWMNLHEGVAGLRADGAYAQWTPWPDRDLHLQAGKIPWPIGTWEARSYSHHNPLIGAPLMYQYHNSLAWNLPTTSVDQLVASAGTGQQGLAYGPDAAFGMTVVDVRYWDVGVVALGAKRPFEFSVGTMQGSPGWPVTDSDDTPGQTVLGRVGLLPTPGLRAGVSGAWGNWQPESFAPLLPPGRSLRDYHEWTAMWDLEASRGRWELHGEGYLKGWQTMLTGNLRLGGGYAETRVEVAGGAWLAARWETMRFSGVRTSAGVTRPWDNDVDRMESGIGYRVSRDVNVKASLQRHVRYGFADKATVRDLVAFATSVRF